MRPSWINAAPAVVLGVGLLLVMGLKPQEEMPLRVPLTSIVPAALGPMAGESVEVTEEEVAVAGFSDYVMQHYENPASENGLDPADGFPAWVTLYVGYYESQTQGKTIHSPRNCLPGAGWEPILYSEHQIATTSGTHPVNQYILQRGQQRALVLYWYQGRGRVQANEYGVKFSLLMDAAFKQRSDEALVRIAIPIIGETDDELAFAEELAARMIPEVARALPAPTTQAST